MATLASQISTDLQVVVASAHLIDLTNQRDSDATLDTTLLTGVANKASAFVQRYLGSVDSTDDAAVEIGVRYALYLLKGPYALISSPNNSDTRASIVAELEDLVERRALEATPQLGSPDFSWVDKVYPGESTQQIDNDDNR